jgi:hypothetical protein
MNLQTKAHGHTLHFAHQRLMAVMDLVTALCAAFLVAQQHLQQLVAITCMRMSKKHYYLKLLHAKSYLGR